MQRLVNRRKLTSLLHLTIRTGLQLVLVLTDLLVELTQLLPCVSHKARLKSFEKLLWSCLCETNYPTQVRRLSWVSFWQNGVIRFVKTNRLYENGFNPLRWDLTSTQLRSHLGGMFFLYVKIFGWAVPTRQDCSFSLGLVFFL